MPNGNVKTISVCNHCGSTDVYADAWVGVNDPDDVLGPYDTYHCEQCEGECSLTEVEVVEIKVELVQMFIDAALEAADRNDCAEPPWVKDLEALIKEHKK